MSNIPKMQLDLDQVMDDHELENPSIADAAVADGVEDEKCVVGQYRTTKQQKAAFASLVQNCDRERIPVEWVIDIADESNGWFYGTAYHYDDNAQMLHVMVPDKMNPTFDGHVQLDHRTVHLIECVDQKSLALFNKIVRDSVLKIKWDVEWYEEYDNDPQQENNGEWISSVARYYIRIANQLLVEDREYDEHEQDQQASKGFVIITADLNVRLQHCHKNKGIEDFFRLINEGIVSFTPEAEEEANIAIQNMSHASPAKGAKENKDKTAVSQSSIPDTATKESNAASGTSSSTPLSLRKLTEVVRHLKDSFLDIIEDYENRRKEELDLSQLYSSFILQGDLEKGLQLMDYFQKVPIRNEKRKAFNRKLSPSKYGSMDDNEYEENQEQEDDLEDDVEERKYRKLLKTLEYASHNSTKLEKQCLKLIKHGYEINSAAAGGGSGGGSNSAMKGPGSSEEFDALKKEYKRLKKELEGKEQEIRVLKNSNTSGIRR